MTTGPKMAPKTLFRLHKFFVTVGNAISKELNNQTISIRCHRHLRDGSVLAVYETSTD